MMQRLHRSLMIRVPYARSLASSTTVIKIRNSLVGGSKILTFSSTNDQSKSLTWYACGPTVYDNAHLGHARTYINTDIIRRILSDHFKIHINFAMGMTDIDNKIIDRSKVEHVTGCGQDLDLPNWLRLARKYETSFLADMDALRVRRPNAILRVTEHLDEIRAYVATILAAGKAYNTPSGVYFSVPSHSSSVSGEYGKLGSIPTSAPAAARAAAAVAHDEEEEKVQQQQQQQQQGLGDDDVDKDSASDKRDPRDFALWKRVDEDEEPGWDSPWGRGRPGWHIECSAVTHSHFGASLDVHSGGIDLRFPHHTNEIAQCEAHNCCDHWVKHWVHTGHLYIDGLKMSKSLKNFVSIEDYLSGQWRTPSAAPPRKNSQALRRDAADDLRIFFLQHKYHSSLHFSADRVDEARQWRGKVTNTLDLIRDVVLDDERRAARSPSSSRAKRLSPSGFKLAEQLKCSEAGLDAALRDDFDTPRALQLLAALCSGANVYAAEVLLDSAVSVAPLPALHRHIAGTLRMLGLSFASSSLTYVADEGSDEGGGGGGGDGSGLVDEFVSMRFRARQCSARQLADIREWKKAMAAAENDNDTASSVLCADVIAKCAKSSGEILTACDESRGVLKDKFGIQISDSKDRSMWKKTH